MPTVKYSYMRTLIMLIIFVPGLLLVANGKMTPVEYQEQTMPQFIDFVEDEIPYMIIDDIQK